MVCDKNNYHKEQERQEKIIIRRTNGVENNTMAQLIVGVDAFHKISLRSRGVVVVVCITSFI